jgi:hypothetical protein
MNGWMDGWMEGWIILLATSNIYAKKTVLVHKLILGIQ